MCDASSFETRKTERIYDQVRGLARAALAVSVALGAVSCLEIPNAPDESELYARDVSPGIHETTPIRGERGPLRLHMDGDAFECSFCHEEGFTGDLSEAALEGQHADITFNHGANLLCLNCHNPKDSDAYVYHDGSEIPGDQPNRLCAKCHGPHYREWQHDVHGRVNTYWDKEFGDQKKLDCIQCHDPHQPSFPKMEPEPAPVLTRFNLSSHGENDDDG